MHNEEYIASGILELYAAGGLSPAEQQEVERRASASPEIRQALDEACAAMEAYAGLYAVRPRAGLKNTIMQRIEGPAGKAQPLRSPAAAPVHPLHPTIRRQRSAYAPMLAASIALFLLSGGLSIHFYFKWQQAEDRLAGVLASEQRLAQNLQQASMRLQNQQLALSILRDPAYKPVRLQGVEAYAQASMMVYWNPDQQRVYVDDIALPAPPAGKQYQLWALADGQPVDAGLIDFSQGQASLQQMKDIGAAQAFAVTLEPTGGSAVPTLELLTAMGKIDS